MKSTQGQLMKSATSFPEINPLNAYAGNVSRGAFYTHYKDLYDLFEQMENELFEDLGKLTYIDSSHSITEAFQSLVDYVEENASVFFFFPN